MNSIMVEVQKKKISPIKNNSPFHDPTLPSQNLGIYLKISPDISFEVKKIALLRVAIFKLLKSMFSLNIYSDGSLLIALQDSKSEDILQNSKCLLNIPIKSALWTPNQNTTKIVVYNISPEIPIQELKEGPFDRTGNPIPVADVTQLGKPDANGQKISKSFLFSLREENNNLGQIFLFGQMKPYKPKHIQCQKWLKLGHTKYVCSEILQVCNNCKSPYPIEMTNCKNDQPKCINCKDPHDSTNKTLCPAYKKKSTNTPNSNRKSHTLPICSNGSKCSSITPDQTLYETTQHFHPQNTNLPKASSTPPP